MTDVPARPSAQQLLDEALARYAANKQKPLVPTEPDLVRVQALAAAVQAEQLTRLADTLDRLTATIDGAITLGESPALRVQADNP